MESEEYKVFSVRLNSEDFEYLESLRKSKQSRNAAIVELIDKERSRNPLTLSGEIEVE